MSPSAVNRVDYGAQLDDIDRTALPIRSGAAASKQNARSTWQLNVIVRAMQPSDSAWVTRLAHHGIAHYCRRALSERASARLRFEPGSNSVQRPMHIEWLYRDRSPPMPSFPEARVWLALADTAAAIASLETALNTAPARDAASVDGTAPQHGTHWLSHPSIRASRAAPGRRDRAEARQSARVAATIWRHADDADLQRTVVAHLREIRNSRCSAVGADSQAQKPNPSTWELS